MASQAKKELPSYCRHFNGVVGHRTCLAGVAYRAVAVVIPSPSDGHPRRQYPCLVPRFDTCTTRAYYSDAERQAARAANSSKTEERLWQS
ncbi:MAG TPA: hypothetical protein VII06_09455 [Chloroflexota bacterium]